MFRFSSKFEYIQKFLARVIVLERSFIHLVKCQNDTRYYRQKLFEHISSNLAKINSSGFTIPPYQKFFANLITALKILKFRYIRSSKDASTQVILSDKFLTNATELFFWQINVNLMIKVS